MTKTDLLLYVVIVGIVGIFVCWGVLRRIEGRVEKHLGDIAQRMEDIATSVDNIERQLEDRFSPPDPPDPYT